jgi:hypothetical protein
MSQMLAGSSRTTSQRGCTSCSVEASQSGVLMKDLRRQLRSFHRRCCRGLARDFIRQEEEGNWICPSTDRVLKKTGVRQLKNAFKRDGMRSWSVRLQETGMKSARIREQLVKTCSGEKLSAAAMMLRGSLTSHLQAPPTCETAVRASSGHTHSLTSQSVPRQNHARACRTHTRRCLSEARESYGRPGRRSIKIALHASSTPHTHFFIERMELVTRIN